MKKALTIGVYNPKLICQASPYCGDNVFARGLEQNGYNVTRFDYRVNNDLHDGLLDTARNIQPDIVWMGKCEKINADTVKALRSLLPNAIFVKWAADVRDYPTEHDLAHNKHIDWFFGTFGGDYLKAHLTPNMKGVGSILTFTDSDFYKPMEVDNKWKSDILWTGRRGFGDNPIRNEIIDWLLNKSTFDTRIFGLDQWIGDPEYLYAINGAKIGIGSNSFNRRKYSSDRLGNFMSCGTFYLTQYIEGIEECFERGKHLDWFESIEEMEDKIKYYLKHDEKREQIAENGRKFVLKYFDTKSLVANLLKVIKTGKKNYHWDDIFLN